MDNWEESARRLKALRTNVMTMMINTKMMMMMMMAMIMMMVPDG